VTSERLKRSGLAEAVDGYLRLGPLWVANVSPDVVGLDGVVDVVDVVDGAVAGGCCRNVGSEGYVCCCYSRCCHCRWSRVVGACQVSAAKMNQMRFIRCSQSTGVGVGQNADDEQ